MMVEKAFDYPCARAFLLGGATLALTLGACSPGPTTAQRQAAGAQAGAEAGGGRGALETRAAEGAGQKPVSPDQTRAPGLRSRTTYRVQTIVRGLNYPWAIAFLPDGRMLVTERAGRLRILTSAGQLSPAVTGLPPQDVDGQGGLLGLALSPTYACDHLVYWSYAERRPDGTGTAVARGRLMDGPQPRMEKVQVIFHQLPSLDSTLHYGGRLVFARDGKLFITLGERSIAAGRAQAQQLNSDLGKIIRINPDGSVPKDNPFVGRPGARPEIWSYGHRNVQAAGLDPSGQLWEVEHGTRGGDELNRVEGGKNYGWAAVAYGIEYGGGPINGGVTRRAGTEQPVYYWDPVIAPSGMTFYTGAAFPEWRGDVFVGSLKEQHIARLVLRNGRVVGEERIAPDIGQRVRDVVQGPDGALYVATDDEDGQIARIVPR